MSTLLKEHIEYFLSLGFERLKGDKKDLARDAFDEANILLKQIPDEFKYNLDDLDHGDIFHPTSYPMQINVAIPQQLDFLMTRGKILGSDITYYDYKNTIENIWKIMATIPDDEEFKIRAFADIPSGSFRRRHGSPFDRGSADYYYNRPCSPHYWPCGTGHGRKVEATHMTEGQIAEYMAGYKEAMEFGDQKEW